MPKYETVTYFGSVSCVHLKLNPLKTIGPGLWGWALWKMCVIANSASLQWVK